MSILTTLRTTRRHATTTHTTLRILTQHAHLTTTLIAIPTTSTLIATHTTPTTAALYAATTLITGLTHKHLTRQAHTATTWARLAHTWHPACTNAGLTRRNTLGEDRAPTITRITHDPTTGATTLTIRPHPHHTPTDYDDPQLRRALGARHATTARGPRGTITLTLHQNPPAPGLSI